MGSTVYFGSYPELPDYHWTECPAWHSSPAFQKQDPADLKVSVKLLLIRSAEVLFLPSSPELRKCFMDTEVRRKLKDTEEDIIRMCISKTCDYIMPCISYSLILFPAQEKTLILLLVILYKWSHPSQLQ